MKLDKLDRKKIFIITGVIIALFIVLIFMMVFNNSRNKDKIIERYEGFTGGDYIPPKFVMVNPKGGWNQPVVFLNKTFTLGEFLTLKIENDVVNYVKTDLSKYVTDDQWPKDGVILEIDNIIINESSYDIKYIEFNITVKDTNYKYKARVRFDKNTARDVMIKSI